tara:strand:+ start:280 stop:1374 length:1095 start_codon:yes stop_codon:yes gene_type:complete
MSKVEYFYDLNYSLANEDTEFERSIVLQNRPNKIISVCGSGSRCFPLLHSEAKELHIIDLSKPQINLAKLREATIKSLEFDDFLKFWGYAPFRVEENSPWRKNTFLDLEMDEGAKKFLNEIFIKNNWSSLLYVGKWEKTFIFFSKIVRLILGENNVRGLFSFDNLSDQKNFMKNKFPSLRWKIILAILGNKSMFNALLYKGDFIKKNIKESYISYYSKAFSHLMNNNIARNSFFLQLCFLGEVKYEEGNLIEATKQCFSDMKESMEKCSIFYHQNDLISEICNHNSVDFISLSDVPSYFSGDLEKQFLKKIHPSLSKDGIIVSRNYLRIPEADRSDMNDILDKFEENRKLEEVQMYKIEVLKNA